MAKAKWFGAFLGLLSGNTLGALAGFVLGALFDVVNDDRMDLLSSDGQGAADGGGSYRNDDVNSDARMRQGTRNGFLFSLLTLASYIIKADGKIMHSEMEAMRQFLRSNFGEIAVAQGEQVILRLFERQKQMDAEQPGAYRQTIYDCCAQLRAVLTESQRLQLLSLLAMLAKADGIVVSEEINALREITIRLGLSEAELNSLLNLGSTTLKDAYTILEIDESATDDEVRAAYKRMVVKHHPDRVASLGEDIRAAAEKKMREINQAKELIYKARGM